MPCVCTVCTFLLGLCLFGDPVKSLLSALLRGLSVASVGLLVGGAGSQPSSPKLASLPQLLEHRRSRFAPCSAS